MAFNVVLGLFAVAGIASVGFGISRKGIPASTRLLYIVIGALVALACSVELMMQIYVASCDPTHSCV